jgi:hypothetical protein
LTGSPTAAITHVRACAAHWLGALADAAHSRSMPKHW